MPVVELRGAIPVGVVMGLPLPTVFLLCVAGNMARPPARKESDIGLLFFGPVTESAAAASREKKKSLDRETWG